MSNKMVFYPCKDVTLKGILSSAYTTLIGVSDSLVRREYAKFAGEFILVSQKMILAAQKELEVSGGITLDASELSLAANKETDLTEGEIVLTALLGMAAKKTLLLMDVLSINGNASLSAQKSIYDLSAAVRLRSDVNNMLMQKTSNTSSGITMSFDITTVSKTVSSTFAKVMLILDSVMDMTAKKQSILSEEQILLRGSLKTVAIRYRTFADIDGVTFQDVRQWDMHTFYILEV